jgi:hypothetical protein
MANLDLHSFTTITDDQVSVRLDREATCHRCSIGYCNHVLEVIKERKDAGTIFLAEGEVDWYFEVPVYPAWGITARCILRDSNKVYLGLRHDIRFLCVLGPGDGRQTIIDTVFDNLRYMGVPYLNEITCESVYHARNQTRIGDFVDRYRYDSPEYTAALLTQLQNHICILCRETAARVQADTDVPETPYVMGYPKRGLIVNTSQPVSNRPFQRGF